MEQREEKRRQTRHKVCGERGVCSLRGYESGLEEQAKVDLFADSVDQREGERSPPGSSTPCISPGHRIAHEQLERAECYHAWVSRGSSACWIGPWLGRLVETSQAGSVLDSDYQCHVSGLMSASDLRPDTTELGAESTRSVPCAQMGRERR